MNNFADIGHHRIRTWMCFQKATTRSLFAKLDASEHDIAFAQIVTKNTNSEQNLKNALKTIDGLIEKLNECDANTGWSFFILDVRGPEKWLPAGLHASHLEAVRDVHDVGVRQARAEEDDPYLAEGAKVRRMVAEAFNQNPSRYVICIRTQDMQKQVLAA